MRVGNAPYGRYRGQPCIFGDPRRMCFRVHPFGMPTALYPRGNGAVALDFGIGRPGIKVWYASMGMNYANLDHCSGDAPYHEVVRQTLAEIAGMPDCLQVVIDPGIMCAGEVLMSEIFPARHPVFSRDKTPGENFAPSIVGIDQDVVGLDPGRGWQLYGVL